MTILTDKEVKTRKEHRCFTCLIKYPAGTVMRYQTGVYDGDLYSLYTCKGCEALMSEYRDVFSDDGVFYEGTVRESMLDEKVSTPEELLEKWEREDLNKKQHVRTN